SHDSLSHKGIAREIARLLCKKIYPEKFVDYKVTSDKKVYIDIKEPKLCPRYTAVVIENVTVKESPAWLKERLLAVGQRPINNIVDITNFVMLETGQPLHAFDLDNLAGKGEPYIVVQKAKNGEKLTLLDGKEVALSGEMLVIATSKEAVAIAGVKGGKTAEINTNTKNIVIESANFESIQVRKTSRALQLRTDSSARFEQGITPEMAEEGIRLAVEMVLEIASGSDTKVGSISDSYPRKRKDYVFGVSATEVNKLLGTKLKDSNIEKILNQLHFKFEKVDPLKKVLEHAPKYIGLPYKLGASISYEAPYAFDCSSFTSYIYSRAGIGLPRMAVDQLVWSKNVSKKEAKPGDLVFSANTGADTLKNESVEFLPGTKVPGGVSHVGIILGDGKVIHASASKGKIVIEKLAESDRFKNVTGYGRVIDSKEKRFAVTAPKERLDLMATRAFLVSGVKEDLIEEIGRTYGYKNIKAVKLPKSNKKVINNEEFDKANKIRESLVNKGFSEVITYAFQDKGDIEIANPIASDKKFLRNNLWDGIREAYRVNKWNAPLLGLSEIKIFEIGKVFGKDKEEIKVSRGIFPISFSDTHEISNPQTIIVGKEEYTIDEAYEKFGKSAPSEIKTEQKKEIKYKHISQYPFVLRDVAVFVPKNVSSEKVLKLIIKKAGKLLVQKKLFDVFKKNDMVSYAFNLVFQSDEKTLSDKEVNKIMEKIIKILNSQKNWKVR
ncbi:MAG: phenylalanine--tRNA ligase beta subunit-related protein, partial [Patescibacteria group bacterium]